MQNRNAGVLQSRITIEAGNFNQSIKMKTNLISQLLALMVLLAGLQQAVADPAITSTVPSDGATGVSPSAPVVFTFNTAMDPTQTSAELTDATANEDPPMTSVWSAGNTVLTCTPSPYFANNHNIQWEVTGFDTLENFLDASGNFTTVAGFNGGSGTNAVTTYVVTKSAGYHQTNTAAPVFLTYNFDANTTLASNRMATNITVTIPTTAVTLKLDEDALQPEMFDTDTPSTTNLTTLNTNYPSGNYSFNVKTIGSSQQQTVTLPNITLPNAPQVGNYTAAQAINPAQPFTLTWNTFTGGGSGDWIYFSIIGEDGVAVFQSPIFGHSGALTGTATSLTIPAGTLQAGTNYAGELIFYHITQTTGGATVTDAAFASGTEFSMMTTVSAGPPPPLLTITPSGTNVVLRWPTNASSFILEFATNLISPVWKTNLVTPVVVNTNNAVTNGISGTQKFYRLSQ
jgi:methionine-rich copper-binding protein CopC